MRAEDVFFFSQYWGAKDDDGICRSYGITMTCLLTIAFIFALFGAFRPDIVMKIYTDNSAIQRIGIDYLIIVSWSYPLMVLAIGMSSLLRCTERVKIPLYASIASVATNTFLNWVLIFGNLDAPALGVRGAAIAAVAVFRTIEGMIIGFFVGFSNAASVLVGKSVGGGEIIIYGATCVLRMRNWTQNDTYRSAGDATFGTILYKYNHIHNRNIYIYCADDKFQK